MSTTAEEKAAQETDEGVVHILWMNGGLSCDGDSVALTAATQPSIEEIVLGALPGLPKIAVHWPLIDFECGPEQGADNFIEWWHKADRGELEPFVLVVEGSIPNEAIKDEGYWAAFGNDPETGQPMHDLASGSTGWRRKATAVVAVGTCATYGGIHAMAGNPTGAMGVPDYLGWDWKSKAGLPIVCVPGLPDPPRQPVRDARLPALPGGRPGADDPARRGAAAARGCSARRSTRAATGPATTSRATSPTEYGSPKCIVKLGCWGPVVKCNVPKRGWINGDRRLPQRRRHLHRLHDARLPRQVHAVHGRAAGRQALVDAAAGSTARPYRRLRSVTHEHARQGTVVAHQGPRAHDRLHEDLVRRTTTMTNRARSSTKADRRRRDVVGPDHPHRRQPRHLRHDRLQGRRRCASATAPRRSSAATACS